MCTPLINLATVEADIHILKFMINCYEANIDHKKYNCLLNALLKSSCIKSQLSYFAQGHETRILANNFKRKLQSFQQNKTLKKIKQQK